MGTMPFHGLVGVIENLEKRVERLEKMLNREFHGSSGYTRGCRCDKCKADLSPIKESK